MPLSTVSKLIAVSSCKGGVGKSTVALELAYHLRRRGHRVGLFDADVHGPSLPTQIPLGDVRITLAADGRSVQPLEHGGVQLMSFGWFSRLWSRRPAAEIRVRGPLATNLLQTTQWGDLDYLLIDSPPGTGDIPSQIARLPLHGAVAVTTPSRLSVVDVVRGILFLRRLGVPVLALVENMASFRCDGCGKDHYPFGRGHAAGVLADVAAAEATDPPPAIPTFALPIVPDLGGASGDSSAAPRLDGASAPLESSLDALADALDRATCGDPPALLPHQLAFHEVPHWPTEMAMAEYVEQRVSVRA